MFKDKKLKFKLEVRKVEAGSLFPNNIIPYSFYTAMGIKSTITSLLQPPASLPSVSLKIFSTVPIQITKKHLYLFVTLHLL
ncbi:hypothetical protein DRF65_23835 [Chryseobacterium pennae]|uniref:Uncharacterized protein n=1 Tax=Chryseobacterium pennae TaxID=2258962 RepID=A0A3D9C325_9FLAO|nr:hypothetical protein DRF65_23835 [Chryseobacterium pennae]